MDANTDGNDKAATGETEENTHDGQPEPPYSVLSEPAKISIILTASFAAIISPISGSIYFPALNSLANDLHVSVSLITLTITTYLIFQGIAPSFIGNFSDRNGRRPAYIICFVIYIGANIGLALQNNYAALMVLRCLQSSGSSGTIALGSAVVADVSTRAQRGKYIGYASMGVTLGPALGPIIGGLLDEYLGWHSIFWFLTIFASVFFVVVLVAMPETARSIVGNGSIPPPRWQLSLIQYFLQHRYEQNTSAMDIETKQRGRRRPNPFASLKIAAQKEAGLILWYGSLLYAGYFAVLSTLSPQLEARYGFNSLKVGLCYLPLGFGSLTSRWTVGRILDKNFHRIARLHGIPIIHNRQQDISSFPVEFARLQITLPLVYGSCIAIVAYAWVMNYKTALAGPLVLLFFVGHLVTGAFSSLNTLVVDINKETPATAVAANNLFRCLMGAGAAAIANPLIDRIGIGWTGTFIALLWVVFSPSLWATWKLEGVKRQTLNIPFITSGGFGDGQGLAAALALGAAGINMGTRFLCTIEAPIHYNIKQAIVDADETDTELVLRPWQNTMRVFKNKVAIQALRIGKDSKAGKFEEVQPLVSGKRGWEVFIKGDKEFGFWSVGQVIGLIHDIPTCEILIKRIEKDASEIMERSRTLWRDDVEIMKSKL